MRFCTLLIAVTFLLAAQAPDEKEAVAAVQRLFDGMAAHDTAMIQSVMLPEARFHAVRDNGNPTTSLAADFASRIGNDKTALIERFTGEPKVLVRGRIAQVWGEYEFIRDGKFGHCGVDTATLFKTDGGWKIASLVYTMETKGCAGQR